MASSVIKDVEPLEAAADMSTETKTVHAKKRLDQNSTS
jgi:hypothetical protein